MFNKEGKEITGLRKKILLVIVGGIILLILLFFLLFRLNNVIITGNTRYSDQEIVEMALDSPWRFNTVIFCFAENYIDMEGTPFLDHITSEYVNRNTVRLDVTEKQLVGFFRIDGVDYYFDEGGVVTDVIDRNAPKEEETSAETGTQAGTEAGTETGTQSGIGSEAQTEAQQEDRTALTRTEEYVPMITGLNADNIGLGCTIEFEHNEVIGTLRALAGMITEYSILPDKVYFDKDYNITLYYGNVRIQLGQDDLLEEKMNRVAAILPNLQGYSGILHLENFTEDTENIVFKKD